MLCGKTCQNNSLVFSLYRPWPNYVKFSKFSYKKNNSYQYIIIMTVVYIYIDPVSVTFYSSENFCTPYTESLYVGYQREILF